MPRPAWATWQLVYGQAHSPQSIPSVFGVSPPYDQSPVHHASHRPSTTPNPSEPSIPRQTYLETRTRFPCNLMYSPIPEDIPSKPRTPELHRYVAWRSVQRLPRCSQHQERVPFIVPDHTSDNNNSLLSLRVAVLLYSLGKFSGASE